eukprot:CAMPEP_0197031682 /NCGR_PEP_ID=MMETSP1384-20130603/10610_1 /TAXON_ID=29189 /ORGANISM="Ammonia sp." /LENGTH=622 /DNA_ID=CAMNT_0042461243 /DNA_START=65 /DNA_END=1933 /DNA_ORIENTATION=-
MNGHRVTQQPPGSPESGSEADPDPEVALQAALGVVESQGLLDRDALHEEAEDDMQEDDEEEEEELHSSAPTQSSHAAAQPQSHAPATRTNRGRFDRYQGHQHTHQQVAYQQRKRMKGAGGVWDPQQYGGMAAGSSFTGGAYGGVRGGAFTGFAGGQAWNNLGANMARTHAGNMHIVHREVQLSKPPRLHRGCPKPLYYWSEEEQRAYLVLSTSCYHNGNKFPRFTGSYGAGMDTKKEVVRYGGTEGCIYKYDFLNDLWTKYRKYQSPAIHEKPAQEFKPVNHGMAIRCNHQRSNELWLFGGNNQVFAYFGLERSEFGEKIYDVSNHQEMHWIYPTSLQIGDEIHIFGRCPNSKYKRHSLHSIFFPDKLQVSRTVFDQDCEMVDREAIRALFQKQDKDREKEKEKDREEKEKEKAVLSAMDDLKEEEIEKLMPNLFCCKAIYVKHAQQVLVFNGQNANIYIWRYSLQTGKWSIFDDDGEVIHLPKQHDNNFDVILLHDSIIVMCYNSSKEIWTYNVGGLVKETGKNNHKWARKNCKDLSGITDDGYMVNVNDEAIHFLSYILPTHCSVWVYHLMPKRIIKRVYAPMLVTHVLRLHLELDDKQMKKIQNIVTVMANHCCIVFYW